MQVLSAVDSGIATGRAKKLLTAVEQIPPSTSAAPLVALRRPQWLPQSVWPFQTSALEVDGSNIAITDVGQGPVLLFVHTGFWSFIWRDVMLRLVPDFRCICFDAPGTGQSDRLPTASVSLEKASRALTAVIQSLNLEDITLVVHDLGGPSGIAGAARVAERIRGLCVVNAFAWEPSGKLFRGMLAVMGSTGVREFSAWTGNPDASGREPIRRWASSRRIQPRGVSRRRRAPRRLRVPWLSARRSQIRGNLRATGSRVQRPISTAATAHDFRRAQRSAWISAKMETIVQ